ncbi:MAG: response regulator transcription factor [Lachnospiraceae bacterium]|nr:response regulator transcription factor [Lachnospiraceae bacterium]
MNKILIVDEDSALAEQMCRMFTDIETRTWSCGTLESAEELLGESAYQVIIIDPELPDGDGYELIYELGLGNYGSGDAAIILIMDNDRKPDMLVLGEQGITDYITKPFNLAVLKAKVWSQFQRSRKDFALKASRRFEAIGAGTKSSIVGEHMVAIDNFMFNFDIGEYSAYGKKVRLNRLEQCLLRNLVENKGIVLKRKALMDKLISESKIYIDESMLEKTVRGLRERLNARRYIKTVYGIGYIWIDVEDKKS